MEEGTPFGRWYVPGEGPMPREEEAVEMFRDASRMLGEAGYEHYEVSSYARPGARCEHNGVYWDSGRRGWYGFGMAATSHVGRGDRIARPRKMREYEAWVDAMPPLEEAAAAAAAAASSEATGSSAPALSLGEDAAGEASQSAMTWEERRAEALLERLMLRLRTSDGIDLDALASEFGEEVPVEVLRVLGDQPPGLAALVVPATMIDGASSEGKGRTRGVEVELGREGGWSKAWREEAAAAAAAAVKDSVSRPPPLTLARDPAASAAVRVRLTDPDGFMVSTELISTLVGRLPSLEAL